MNARLFFCGDIVNTKCQKSFISDEIQTIIKSQDYSICNFEAPIEGYGEKAQKAGPHVAQKAETLKLLKDAGFSLLLLANNHIYDYGEVALSATIDEISKHDLNCIGAGLDYKGAYKAFIKEINGIKIAFINASEAQFGVLDNTDNKHKSGYAWINHHLFDELVISSKKVSDVVIVCVHAGLEDYYAPIEEWKSRYKRLCDIGADCIIGSHPHVPQGYELYNNKPIFYSLGNFYFDNLSFKDSPDYSYSVILDISIDSIKFELVYHNKDNNIVQLSKLENIPFNINDLNDLLDDKIELNKMYLDSYHKITRPFFASVYNSIIPSDSFIVVLKKIILKILPLSSLKKRRELLLLHLIRNETYRWVTIRAIQMINNK